MGSSCQSASWRRRDIKPENIFLTTGLAFKLGDFGLAIKADEELPFTRSGTLDYMAPEVRQIRLVTSQGLPHHALACSLQHLPDQWKTAGASRPRLIRLPAPRHEPTDHPLPALLMHVTK